MATAALAVATCFLSAVGTVSCDDKKDGVALDSNRSLVPTLRSTDVSMLVSDSGVTRYRASTKEWLIYSKADPPTWEFPSGLRIEQFDTNMETEANIYCNRAHYSVNTKLWELDDSVMVTNRKGERFETDQLFWDQVAKKVYSDKKIKIRQEGSIITGRGFESNETMTQYIIRKPEGIFPIKDN